MSQSFSVVRDGHLTIVTLERPEARNALDAKASHELGRVFDEFESDPDQWVAILTGAGDSAFCTGMDLREYSSSDFVSEGGMPDLPPSGFCGMTSRYNMVKPVIAAVNGVAMGGGFETVLACDLIVADRRAQFALSEPRVGLVGWGGGIQRLARQIGLKPAMGMLLTGRRVSAAEAHQVGLVNEVTEDGTCLEAAKAWAAQILECAPLSVRLTKEAAMKGLTYRSVEEAQNAHYDGYDVLLHSADTKEGLKAFMEKRKPQWNGR